MTKYPQAAGAALYTHKAFGVHFFTFLVAFTVMSSGITSASTAANAFAGFVNDGFKLGFEVGGTAITVIAIGFMLLIAAVNFRGVGESVKAQRRAHAGRAFRPSAGDLRRPVGHGRGDADFTEVMVFESSRGQGRLLRGHRRHVARVLRDGRLRGLGQHGRGGARTPPATSRG